MMYVCQKAALVMYYARPSVTEDSLAEAFRDQLTILLFMHVAFSFVFYAKQEFDVYGIGADRYSAFALGSAPFGVALLMAGWDALEGPRLYHTDPSGTYIECEAKAIGSAAEVAPRSFAR